MATSFFADIVDRDLLGDPIIVNRGKPGRPRHLITARNARKFNALLAAGISRREIARALGISEPTLRKGYLRASEKRPGGGARPGAGRPRGAKSRPRSDLVARTDAMLSRPGFDARRAAPTRGD
jgi:transposase-like protein